MNRSQINNMHLQIEFHFMLTLNYETIKYKKYNKLN